MFLGEESLARPLLSIVVAIFAISYYVTGSFTWGYESHWLEPRYLKFRAMGKLQNFTEATLSRYDGSDSALPIYLAVDGMVFDVSSKPQTYSSIGSYGFFSGKDAARAYATGCFETDLTHDLRGLSEDELAAVKGWQRYFAKHSKYWHVGYVEHPPLTGEPPKPCKARQKPGR